MEASENSTPSSAELSNLVLGIVLEYKAKQMLKIYEK